MIRIIIIAVLALGGLAFMFLKPKGNPSVNGKPLVDDEDDDLSEPLGEDDVRNISKPTLVKGKLLEYGLGNEFASILVDQIKQISLLETTDGLELYVSKAAADAYNPTNELFATWFGSRFVNHNGSTYTYSIIK